MNSEEYWEMVAKVDWPSLCNSPTDEVDAGKDILTELLPTKQDMENFRAAGAEAKKMLVDAMDAWEAKQGRDDPTWAGWGVGDDSYSDLANHIIGCGKDEWAATIIDPSKAYARCQHKYTTGNKKSDGYVESFSYCIPYKEDYDETSVKLTRCVGALHHWIHRAAKVSANDSTSAMDEVASLVKEITTLEKKLLQETGIVSDQTANVPERIHAVKVDIAKRMLADFLDARIKVEMGIKEARENLDSLLSE